MLVTRAEPGAGETAARLVALGHEAVLAPMLTIEDVAAEPAVDDFAALLFTSANGVLAFARANRRRDLPAYCVGEATGDAARAARFSDVRVAGGDVGALAAFVARSRRPQDGALLHVAGADLAGDLVGALALTGFTAERRVFYRARAATHLPPHAETALTADVPRLRAVLFHSARGATTFANLVKHRIDCNRITALCLSRTVADAARVIAWRDVLAAQAPREAALLALLDGLPEEN